MTGYKTVQSERFVTRSQAIEAFVKNWNYQPHFADYNESATKFWTFSRLQRVYDDHCENYVKTEHGRTRKENIR